MISTKERLLWKEKHASQPRPTRIPIPNVVRFTGLILIGIFIVTMFLVLVSRSTVVRFDLVNAYANIMPGQPRANTGADGFECSLYYRSDHSVEECSLRPATGIFSRISISIRRYNDTIDGVIFTPRENALTLGEAALVFGVPARGQRQLNSWILDEFSAVVTMDAGRFSYFQPIRAIHLYYRPLPDLGHH